MVDWGIVQSFEDSLTCKRGEKNQCRPVLNDNAMNAYLKENCLTKKSCELKDLHQFLVTAGDPATKMLVK
jgi:hypothetical protein